MLIPLLSSLLCQYTVWVSCYVWLPCVLSVSLGLVSSVSPCLWCLETWVLVRYWALYPTTNTCLVFFSSLQCWSELAQVESVRFPTVTLLFLLFTLCLLEVDYLHPMCLSSWGLTIYRTYLKCFCWAGLAILHVLLYLIICSYEYKPHFLVWWKNSLILSLPRIYHRKFYFIYVFILHFELESTTALILLSYHYNFNLQILFQLASKLP